MGLQALFSRSPRWRRLFLAALLIVPLSPAVFGQPPTISLQATEKTISIVPGAGIVGDPGRHMTVVDAEHAEYAPLSADQKVNSAASVYWVRLPLHRVGDPTTGWMLRVELGWDNVDLYVPGLNGYTRVHSGDQLSPSERPIVSNLVVFRIPPFAGSDTTLYVRMEGDTSHYGSARTTRMSIERTDEFLRETRRFNYAEGIYAGIILAMVSYNLILFFGVGEWTYFFYSIYVLAFGAVWMGRAAFTRQYLWPHAPHWDAASGFYLVAIAIFFSVFFVRSFLNIRKWSRPIDVALWVLASVTALLALAGLCGGIRIASPLLAMDALLTSLFYGVIGILLLVRGYRPARLFLTAWWVLIATNIVYILAYLDVLPKNAFTYNSAQIGSGIECILLAFALADRVSAMKSDREREQEDYTARLEVEVQRRTVELHELNQQLTNASITDPLTGLKNRRYIDATIEALTSEVRRAIYKHKHREDVLICIADLDRFKKINDTYGHEVGDRMLKSVAGVLARSIRGSTQLARWGGEEFLLLDRVVPTDDDLQFAERLRRVVAEDVSLRAPDGEGQLTLSLGLARFPLSRRHPDLLGWQDVLSLADQALYRAKHSGRNRWTCVRANEERLQAYVDRNGIDAARNLCRNRLPEALQSGILEFVTKTGESREVLSQESS